jgi:hypothetical protein
MKVLKNLPGNGGGLGNNRKSFLRALAHLKPGILILIIMVHINEEKGICIEVKTDNPIQLLSDWSGALLEILCYPIKEDSAEIKFFAEELHRILNGDGEKNGIWGGEVHMSNGKIKIWLYGEWSDDLNDLKESIIATTYHAIKNGVALEDYYQVLFRMLYEMSGKSNEVEQFKEDYEVTEEEIE